MNNETLAKIWETLICYPRLPFEQVAKRCKVSLFDVDNAAALMGKFANNAKERNL